MTDDPSTNGATPHRHYIREPEPDALRRLWPRLLRKAGYLIGHFKLNTKPANLVCEAIDHIYEGRCPADVNVYAFLAKTMLGIAYRQATTRRMVPLSEAPEGDVASSPEDDAIGAVDGVLRERLVAYVRQVAEEKNDLEVYLLIDAYLAGHTKRSELAEHAGLTLSQYGAAKKRLRTLLLQAPPDLLAVMEHAS